MITLDTVVAYEDQKNGKFYEQCCIRFMESQAIPATLETVGHYDPPCGGCGVPVLSQVEMYWYNQLTQEKHT